MNIMGDILVVITGREVVWVEARDDADAKYPAVHRAALPLTTPNPSALRKIIWPKVSSVLRLRNYALEHFCL